LFIYLLTNNSKLLLNIHNLSTLNIDHQDKFMNNYDLK